MKGALFAAALLASCAALAQQKTADVVPVNCVVMIGNQTAFPGANGRYAITNVPSANPIRAQLTCIEADGTLTAAVTEQVEPVPGGITSLGTFPPRVPLPPLPERLEVSPVSEILSVGQTTRITVKSVAPDGSSTDVTALALYRTGSVAATVDKNGRVTAVQPGEALVGVTWAGRVKVVSLSVRGNPDRDGDGIPNDVELKWGLDPADPADARLDPDRDGLTNLDEYHWGTEFDVADTDGDGLDDGREVLLGSDPLRYDTDGDGLRDGADNCPTVANADQRDSNGNGVGDACDSSGCSADAQCDDGARCTADRCNLSTGKCEHAPVPGCCKTQLDCADNDACTSDGCDVGTGLCTNMVAAGCCNGPADCPSHACVQRACVAPTCSDGFKDGVETDVDCGGACVSCPVGKRCAVAADCSTGVCASGVCQAASCFDQVKNGDETDKDCGGASCPACVAGKACKLDGDCVSQLCQGGVCDACDCLIGGACVPAGLHNPGNDCEACQPQTAYTAWSLRASGPCTQGGAAGQCHGPPDQCCSGCWTGSTCELGDSTAACGAAGAVCTACECAIDACTAGTCTPVPGSAAQVSASGNHACARRLDGSAWCWGANASGELGQGDNLQRLVPARVGSANDWVQVAAGGANSCALKGDGGLWCWGDNSVGALGVGDRVDRHAPTAIDAGTQGFASFGIGVGGANVCGIKPDGTLWCWGVNDYGGISIGLYPTQIGVDTDWKQIAVGRYGTYCPPAGPRVIGHFCGVKTGGQLYCWGESSAGELGQGGTATQVNPTQTGTATDWAEVATGGYYPGGSCVTRGHTCAVKTDGSLWCWGYGGDGALGTGSFGNQTAPARVGVDNDWAHVAAGSFHTCAVKTGGRLYCWGGNANGQLGINNAVNQNAPVQVGTDSDWVAVSGGYGHTCAVKASGRPYCWGSNSNGQAGRAGLLGPELTPLRACLP